MAYRFWKLHKEARIAQLTLEGKSQEDIANVLGIGISTVDRYRKKIAADYNSIRTGSTKTWIETSHARLEEIFIEAWKAWEKSKAANNPACRFLELACNVTGRVMLLRGLASPKKTEISGPEGGPLLMAIRHMSDEELEAQIVADRAKIDSITVASVPMGPVEPMVVALQPVLRAPDAKRIPWCTLIGELD